MPLIQVRERWKGLRFQFPNWSVRLPVFLFFMTNPTPSRPAARLWTSSALMPTSSRRRSAAVSPCWHCGAVMDGSDGPFEAENVVVAIGPYQRTDDSILVAGRDWRVPGARQPLQ